jgi:hypothetical protein
MWGNAFGVMGSWGMDGRCVDVLLIERVGVSERRCTDVKGCFSTHSHSRVTQK